MAAHNEETELGEPEDGDQNLDQDHGGDGDDNRPQQNVENNVDIKSKLFAVIAVSALSLLVAIATLILTITLPMSVKDRTEAASKVKGDFLNRSFSYTLLSFPTIYALSKRNQNLSAHVTRKRYELLF